MKKICLVFDLNVLFIFFLFLPLILKSQDNGIIKIEKCGLFYIPIQNNWIFANKKDDVFFIYENKENNIVLKIKKEPVPCSSSQQFNEYILQLINGLSSQKEFVELRKLSVPLNLLDQKNSHFLKVKSRISGAIRFIYNPIQEKNVFHFEIVENNNGNEPSEEAKKFLISISLSPLSGTDMVQINDQDGLSKDLDKKIIDNEIDNEISITPRSQDYDPGISDLASKIPDGDEMDPVINPIGFVNSIAPDAGWAIGLAKNPKPLLDALEGGRPGGDVHAMMTLLRQTQGPFDENEEQAMMKQYAQYAASGSSKAHKAIRAQNELLLQAMIHRQLMIQAAWEYDFAISQNEIAKLMQDEEEIELTGTLAEIQRSLMEEQQKAMEILVKQSESAPQIPTPSELEAEEKEERENAETALGIESENSKLSDPETRLIGYLKYEDTYIKHDTSAYWLSLPPEERSIITIKGNNSVSFYQKKEFEAGYKPGTTEFWRDTQIESYECTWQTPGIIPLYAKFTKSSNQLLNIPFNVTLKDKGSKAHTYVGVVNHLISVGSGYSSTKGDFPLENNTTGEGIVRYYDGLEIQFADPGKSRPIDHGPNDNIKWTKNGILSEIMPGGDMPGILLNNPDGINYSIYICIAGDDWIAYNRFMWEPADFKSGQTENKTNNDPNLSDEKNQAIAEHENNIAAAKRMIKSIRKEMAEEKSIQRREELRLQSLHMEQNIHDSNDLIKSIKTGKIVKTRGPWDEHSAVVLIETSRKLREDFLRASQMQASYVRMLNILKKYNPVEAKNLRMKMSSDVIKGIFDPGGFEKAKSAVDALYISTKDAAQTEQIKLETNQNRAFEYLGMVERHLEYAETLKKGCDKAVFWGTMGVSLAPALMLSMAYEGACSSVEKGLTIELLKDIGWQGTQVLLLAGTVKAGSWGIGKLLNPKVVKSEVNTFKNILEKHRYDQEMEWNQALVNNLKDKVRAFEKSKVSGGKNYLEVRKALDDAVSAANSSGLAKKIMKNELNIIENQIQSGVVKDYSKLKECLGYQKVFQNRLQKSIYPRTDAEMINKLRSQGYNIEKRWFQEYRNASSRGINADRDPGLIAQYENMVAKNGQPVSMGQFMDEAQKAYEASYKAITGRSAKLADHSVTTSAHSESFPVSWLQKKIEGPFSTLDPPVNPKDFEKAGNAIYNKVEKALAGPDPAFVNMKKACASLSKDLKTKVFERLKNPPPNAGGTQMSRKAALQHWEQVQKVLEDFASDQSDPLTTMKKLQQLTGSTSIEQSAKEIERLVNKLGGTAPK